MNTIRKFTVITAGLLSATLFAAEAPAQTAKQVGQVRQACATTMGLSPANADYDMCVARLQRTMARMDQAAQVERDRDSPARPNSPSASWTQGRPRPTEPSCRGTGE